MIIESTRLLSANESKNTGPYSLSFPAGTVNSELITSFFITSEAFSISVPYATLKSILTDLNFLKLVSLIIRELILLLGTMISTVPRLLRTTCLGVMSATTPAVPFSSSIQSPISKGLLSVIAIPLKKSPNTGCAARPATAPIIAVPWKRTLPISVVAVELTRTQITATRIIAVLMMFWVKRMVRFFLSLSLLFTNLPYICRIIVVAIAAITA